MSSKLIKPSDAEEAQLTAQALTDEDNLPLSDAQLALMKPARGRPPGIDPKIQLSVRYSSEVVDYFRSTGAGWQSRMNDVLLAYVARQKS